jgi:hypothetical protein
MAPSRYCSIVIGAEIHCSTAGASNEKLKRSAEKGQKHECNTHSTDRVYKVNLNAQGAPLWVISGHTDKSAPRPLYPQ